MEIDLYVDLVRHMLLEAMILSAPLLVSVCIVSFVIGLLQTLTSIQEQTLTAVPRLVAGFAVTMLTLPWTAHRLVKFTAGLLNDFHKYVG